MVRRHPADHPAFTKRRTSPVSYSLTLLGEWLRIVIVSGRLAKFAAAWVVVAVTCSTVLTCLPGSMRMVPTSMPGCAAMHGDGPAMSGDPAAPCCVRHELSLAPGQVDLRVSRLVPLSSIESPAAGAAFLSVLRRARSVPRLSPTSGPPAYISLSTLRV